MITKKANRLQKLLRTFALLWLVLADGQAQLPPPPSVPRIQCPIYVMEYHVWYRSPFGSHNPGFVHWGDAETIENPSATDESIRDISAVGYPLLGLYDSENPDVIRWQLRCAHNAGIDGLFVQLFPNQSTGTYLGGSRIFATILKIAAEEHIMVAAHDEVMFRPKWKAQEKKVMAARIGGFVRQFGSDPAYLKIDGHPVYSFQYWTHFMAPEDMAECLDEAARQASQPIHFLILGGTDTLYQRASPSSFVVTGNSNFISSSQRENSPGGFDWTRLSVNIFSLGHLRSRFPNQHFGLWAYPGFDNSPQFRMVRNPNPPAGFSRQGGEVLAQLLNKYSETKPDFILLSSWNDWMENTALEPGLRYNRTASGPDSSDPYFYLRLLAAARGKEFQIPPLPPAESVDPLLRQKLFAIDLIPPKLISAEISNNGRDIQASWSDSAHPVFESCWTRNGDAWIDFLTNPTSASKLKTDPDPIMAVGLNGFKLTSDHPLTLNLDRPGPLGRLGKWYLVLEVQDIAPAVIKIEYPSTQKFIDYREFDEATFPVQALIRTGYNSPTPHAECRLLRDADINDAQTEITLKVSARLGSIAPPAAYIRRIHFFHSLDPVIPGKGTSPAPFPSPTSFHYSLTETAPDFSFLFARDSENNWSSPQIIAAHH